MYATKRPKGVKARYLTPEQLDQQLTPHTKRLTSKQAKFIELLASGLKHGEARKQAGMANSSAFYCLQNPVAQQYLSAIRSESRAIAAYDIAMAMQEALDDHKFAVEKGNAMAAVKATELRAKLSGLLIDRVEIATIDLAGSLARAEARVLNVTPASTQHTQAVTQADVDKAR